MGIRTKIKLPEPIKQACVAFTGKQKSLIVLLMTTKKGKEMHSNLKRAKCPKGRARQLLMKVVCSQLLHNAKIV